MPWVSLQIEMLVEPHVMKASIQQSFLHPPTLGHFTEGLRVVLHAWILDLERLVDLAEETAPVGHPEEVGKVAVVPLQVYLS